MNFVETHIYFSVSRALLHLCLWNCVQQNTRIPAGDKTAVTNDRAGRVLIGCEGEFSRNKNRAFWGQGGTSDWQCFMSRHDGVGVFVQ